MKCTKLQHINMQWMSWNIRHHGTFQKTALLKQIKSPFYIEVFTFLSCVCVWGCQGISMSPCERRLSPSHPMFSTFSLLSSFWSSVFCFIRSPGSFCEGIRKPEKDPPEGFFSAQGFNIEMDIRLKIRLENKKQLWMFVKKAFHGIEVSSTFFL